MSPIKGKSFQASAPGSLMLLGEYAVLQNKLALVCAIDKRMTVTVTPRSDKTIEIISQGYGQWSGCLSDLKLVPPFQFVAAALLSFRKKIKSGCTVYITSEFSDKIGLGSSAAVTVATLSAFAKWLGVRMSQRDLVKAGRQIIRQVQGAGSGADVAASVMGGMVAYRAQPLYLKRYAHSPDLTVIYSGSKTPTPIAIKRVKERFAKSPALFKALCSAIHECSKQGISALQKKNWPSLGHAMTVQQGLMQGLGVSMPLLDELIQHLAIDKQILGAKITGSGWGDCVLGLGKANPMGLEQRYSGVKQLSLRVTNHGVKIQ